MSETQTKEEEVKSSSPTGERKRTDSESGCPSSPEIHFEPIIQLPLVDVKTLEENEEEIIKLRAKLYRYDTTESPPEFKERGTGEVKLLRHKATHNVRILMRRDKTFKLCANHYILPSMELKKHNNSDKVFVWNTLADLSDDTPKPETLAIRFGNVENAQKFKDAFEEAKKSGKSDDENEIANHLSKVDINSKETEGKNDDQEESSDSDSEDETPEDNKKDDKNATQEEAVKK